MDSEGGWMLNMQQAEGEAGVPLRLAASRARQSSKAESKPPSSSLTTAASGAACDAPTPPAKVGRRTGSPRPVALIWHSRRPAPPRHPPLLVRGTSAGQAVPTRPSLRHSSRGRRHLPRLPRTTNSKDKTPSTTVGISRGLRTPTQLTAPPLQNGLFHGPLDHSGGGRRSGSPLGPFDQSPYKKWETDKGGYGDNPEA